MDKAIIRAVITIIVTNNNREFGTHIEVDNIDDAIEMFPDIVETYRQSQYQIKYMRIEVLPGSCPKMEV